MKDSVEPHDSVIVNNTFRTSNADAIVRIAQMSNEVYVYYGDKTFNLYAVDFRRPTCSSLLLSAIFQPKWNSRTNRPTTPKNLEVTSYRASFDTTGCSGSSGCFCCSRSHCMPSCSDCIGLNDGLGRLCVLGCLGCGRLTSGR